MKTIFLGYGNDESRGPIPRDWCIHRVTIRPIQELGNFGKARLVDDGRRIAAYTCAPGTCQLQDQQTYAPPRLVAEGSTLAYRFTCSNNTATPEDECTDEFPNGATIEIEYEPLPAP